MTNDYVNCAFEAIGGLLCWINVWKIIQDRKVVGIYWPVQAFFAIWGIWNLYYYPSLGQWASFIGGVFLVSGNLTWVLFAIKFSRGEK